MGLAGYDGDENMHEGSITRPGKLGEHGAKKENCVEGTGHPCPGPSPGSYVEKFNVLKGRGTEESGGERGDHYRKEGDLELRKGKEDGRLRPLKKKRLDRNAFQQQGGKKKKK